MSPAQEVQSHLLDGTEIEYTYPDEGTVVVTFYEGHMKFNWIAGPFRGAAGSDFVYRARQTGLQQYLVNWQEPESGDFVTSSSILMNGRCMDRHCSRRTAR